MGAALSQETRRPNQGPDSGSLALRPYQVEGALWLACSDKAMLTDPPGLGKTAQVIAAAKVVGAKKILVVAPAVAVPNWRAEFAMWWPVGDYELLVYSYDAVSRNMKVFSQVIGFRPDVLVIDEAHYLKNQESRRTKVIYRPRNPERGLASFAKRVWSLTGTPAPNHVGEYYTHLRVLRPDLITVNGKVLSYNEFLDRYNNWRPGSYKIDVMGVKKGMAPVIRQMLREMCLRREVAAVLPELPPIQYGTITVESTDVQGQLARAIEDDHVKFVLDHYQDTDNWIAPVHLARLRRVIGEAKAPLVALKVYEELAGQEYKKVVLWAWHSQCIREAAAILDQFGVVVIDGSVPQAERAARVEAFQKPDGPRVFIGQIQAAGTAITLTAANQVVFLESSWVPDEDAQAAKRCHRFGQQWPVFVRFAVLADSPDTLVMRVHTRKLNQQIHIGEQP